MDRLSRHEIIRRCGGAMKISRHLAEKGKPITPSAVSRWGMEGGNIPRGYWLDLIEMASDLRPLTSDDLLAAHSETEDV